jgi:hypothetical protein
MRRRSLLGDVDMFNIAFMQHFAAAANNGGGAVAAREMMPDLQFLAHGLGSVFVAHREKIEGRASFLPPW